MFEMKIDTSDMLRVVDQMEGAFDQVPFAMSRALNDAAFEARQHLIDVTWPQSVTRRNTGFLAQALHIERSNKYDLSVSIVDKLGRANLAKHADGGVKLPRGAHLAIPTSAVSIGSHGVAPGQKPAVLTNKIVKGNGIYQWQGKGKNRHLVLMYVLATHATIKKDVPFREDFQTVMMSSMTASFPKRMEEAMETRK